MKQYSRSRHETKGLHTAVKRGACLLSAFALTGCGGGALDITRENGGQQRLGGVEFVGNPTGVVGKYLQEITPSALKETQKNTTLIFIEGNHDNASAAESAKRALADGNQVILDSDGSAESMLRVAEVLERIDAPRFELAAARIFPTLGAFNTRVSREIRQHRFAIAPISTSDAIIRSAEFDQPEEYSAILSSSPNVVLADIIGYPKPATAKDVMRTLSLENEPKDVGLTFRKGAFDAAFTDLGRSYRRITGYHDNPGTMCNGIRGNTSEWPIYSGRSPTTSCPVTADFQTCDYKMPPSPRQIIHRYVPLNANVTTTNSIKEWTKPNLNSAQMISASLKAPRAKISVPSGEGPITFVPGYSYHMVEVQAFRWTWGDMVGAWRKKSSTKDGSFYYWDEEYIHSKWSAHHTVDINGPARRVQSWRGGVSDNPCANRMPG